MIPSLPSRGLRGYSGGVLAGGISAALFAVAMMHAETLFVVIVYMTAMPLLMAGLGAGITSGATASFTGITGLLLAKQLELHFLFAGTYALIYALPCVALVALALRRHEDKSGKVVWSTEGNILIALTLYPAILFLAAVMATSSHDGGLLELTKHTFAASLAPLKSMPEVDADTFKFLSASMEKFAVVAPAVVGSSWLFVMLLSLVAAQGALKQQGWNLRPNFAFQNIYIPNWLIFATAATGVMGAVAHAPYNYVGTNLCAMLCIPFLLVGFAIVHALAAMTKARMVILVAFYILLSVVMLNAVAMMWVVVAMTGLGVVDQWINVRQRFATGWKKGG